MAQAVAATLKNSTWGRYRDAQKPRPTTVNDSGGDGCTAPTQGGRVASCDTFALVGGRSGPGHGSALRLRDGREPPACPGMRCLQGHANPRAVSVELSAAASVASAAARERLQNSSGLFREFHCRCGGFGAVSFQ
jgi:hypothetical protein